MKVISATRMKECHKCNWDIKVKSIMTTLTHTKEGKMWLSWVWRIVSASSGAQMAFRKMLWAVYFNIFCYVIFGNRMSSTHKEFPHAWPPGGWQRGKVTQARTGWRASIVDAQQACWGTMVTQGARCCLAWSLWSSLLRQTWGLGASFKK